jgi:hypothetical protein
MNVMMYLCSFKTSEYISTLKKINPQILRVVGYWLSLGELRTLQQDNEMT